MRHTQLANVQECERWLHPSSETILNTTNGYQLFGNTIKFTYLANKIQLLVGVDAIFELFTAFSPSSYQHIESRYLEYLEHRV